MPLTTRLDDLAHLPQMVQGTLAPQRSERSRSPKGRARATAAVPPVKGWTIAQRIGDGPVGTAGLTHRNQPIGIGFTNLHSPFNPSSFPNAMSQRQTLTLRLPREWEEALQCMESALLDRVAASSAEIFGREMPEEQVREMYKSITRKTGDYPMNVRVKLSSTGFSTTRYWSPGGVRVEPPESHECKDFNAKVVLRALWFADDAWGLVIDCTDLQEVTGDLDPCPFTN